MKNYMKILLPLFCLHLGFGNCDAIENNSYSNEYFKVQLDSSFKKYFNDNIYKIREYSRERRFFNKRNVFAREEAEEPGEVKDLSCGSSFIQSLIDCKPEENDKFSCVKSLSVTEFSAYLGCTTNTEVPNYGDLINSIVLSSLSTSASSSYSTISDAIVDVYTKIKFVEQQDYTSSTTTSFISNFSTNGEKKKLVSSNILYCLNLVEQEIYSSDVASVCLCGNSYSSDKKLVALYNYYGFTEEAFNSVCNEVLEKSEVYNNENEFISNLSAQNLLTLLEAYHIPNYGALFNELMINSLKTSEESVKQNIYTLYNDISTAIKEKYNSSGNNAETIELGRCLTQVSNQIISNSGFSYCLCNGGFNVFEELNAIYTNNGLNEEKFNEKCADIKKERDTVPYCRLGKSVEKCFDKIDKVFPTHDNHTECLDIGVTDSYKMQTKCLCDLYNATWIENEFLNCYGYTELSFTLGCRQFYPNQMFSNDPARGIENYIDDDYIKPCKDSGIGGKYVFDTCVCNFRKERGDVSIELDDICSRVGDKPYDTCSYGELLFKFSKLLMVFCITISIFMYI